VAGPPPLALPRLPAARRAALPAGRRRFRLLPSLWLGTGLLAAVLGLALLAGPLTRLDPTRTGAPPLHPPSAAHPLGTDDLGRDLWSNVAFGARASLAVGVGATALATVAGVAVGAAAGLYGGWWDEGLMRGAEFVQVIPRLLVALLLVALFGGDLLILVAVIALTGWPMTARLVRGEVLALRERDFALAARALGASGWRLLWRHLLPNAFPAVLVGLPIQVGRAILIESGLTFLGVGDPGVPSWGKVMQSAQAYMREAWWLAVFPGIALTVTVLALYLIAEGLHTLTTPTLARQHPLGPWRGERRPADAA